MSMPFKRIWLSRFLKEEVLIMETSLISVFAGLSIVFGLLAGFETF
jgi:hypothetical protein